MRRAKQLQPVGKLMEELERESLLRVSAAQSRLDEAQQRRADLQRYLDEYREMFAQRARSGMGVTGMRDYQIFIARLAEAVQAQQSMVEQLTLECQRERESWMQAAARKSAVGKAIDKAHAEDRKAEDRRTQRELDERAQRQRGAL
ncbi:MAG TPA: flagellar export protein FliJ [Steroidobacteraceae bacterium]|nr:flagellar export protein FliJ [Steroidobacteraceae bacterium]